MSKAQSCICNESLLDKAYCIYWIIEFQTFFCGKGGAIAPNAPPVPTAMYRILSVTIQSMVTQIAQMQDKIISMYYIHSISQQVPFMEQEILTLLSIRSHNFGQTSLKATINTNSYMYTFLRHTIQIKSRLKHIFF